MSFRTRCRTSESGVFVIERFEGMDGDLDVGALHRTRGGGSVGFIYFIAAEQ